MRSQVNNLPGPQALQPQVTPVNTYYQPAQGPVNLPPAGANKLEQLSQALAPLSGTLQKLSDEQAERAKEQAKIEASNLAAKNRASWKTFVKANPNYRGANPWVGVFYDQMQLETVASEFDRNIKTDWAKDPVKNSDDPNAFENFFQSRFQKTLEGLSKEYSPRDLQAAFFPKIQQSKASLQTEHVNYRQKQRVEDAHGALNQNVFTEAGNFKGLLESSYTNLEGSTAEEIAAERAIVLSKLLQQYGKTITDKLKEGVESGLDGKRLNKEAVESLISYAESQEDPGTAIEIMKLAEHIKTGSGVLGSIPEAREKITQAKNRIFSNTMQQEEYIHRLKKREAEKKITKITSLGLEQIIKHQSGEAAGTIDKLLQMGKEEGSSEAFSSAQRLLELWKTLQKEDNTVQEDEAEVAEARFKIYTQPEYDPFKKPGFVGRIKPSTVGVLHNDMQTREQHIKNKYADYSQGMEDDLAALRELFKPQLSITDKALGRKPADTSRKIIGTFRKRWNDWNLSNPTVLPEEGLKKWEELLSEYEKKASQKASPSTSTSSTPSPSKPAPSKPKPTSNTNKPKGADKSALMKQREAIIRELQSRQGNKK